MLIDPSVLDPETPRALRQVEYERLVDLGMFEDEHVELLYGVLVQMSPHSASHDFPIERLTELLVMGLRGRASVRVHSSFVASDDSQPQPDVAVVPRSDYSKAHPAKAHLIVEVAKSSLRKDRGIKARLYAECGVPQYWVVNVVDRMIEVHSVIVRGAYTRVTPYTPGQTIRLLEFADVEVAVSDVLPTT